MIDDRKMQEKSEMWEVRRWTVLVCFSWHTSVILELHSIEGETKIQRQCEVGRGGGRGASGRQKRTKKREARFVVAFLLQSSSPLELGLELAELDLGGLVLELLMLELLVLELALLELAMTTNDDGGVTGVTRVTILRWGATNDDGLAVGHVLRRRSTSHDNVLLRRRSSHHHSSLRSAVSLNNDLLLGGRSHHHASLGSTVSLDNDLLLRGRSHHHASLRRSTHHHSSLRGSTHNGTSSYSKVQWVQVHLDLSTRSLSRSDRNPHFVLCSRSTQPSQGDDTLTNLGLSSMIVHGDLDLILGRVGNGDIKRLIPDRISSLQ
jgi:hypothetical protein